jgi:hypothetical protein
MSRREVLAAGLFLAAALPSMAAAAEVSESTFNAGGHPEQGVVPASAAFMISLGSLGEPFPFMDLRDRMLLQTGFLGGLHPPGEVLNLRFIDPIALAWDPEPSAGSYNLYRGSIGGAPGDPGACLQPELPDTSTIDLDPAPPAGQAWFYLVTVKNRLGENGTPGFDSQGAPRPDPSPCP